MCGIAGIVDLSGQRPVPPGVLQKMADAIVHRGPDEEGFLHRPHLGLASRRLSIVGLADGFRRIFASTIFFGTNEATPRAEVWDCRGPMVCSRQHSITALPSTHEGMGWPGSRAAAALRPARWLNGKLSRLARHRRAHPRRDRFQAAIRRPAAGTSP